MLPRFDVSEVHDVWVAADEVKCSILLGIQFLRDERDLDPDRGLLRRVGRGLPRPALSSVVSPSAIRAPRCSS